MSDFLRNLRSRQAKTGNSSNFDGYYRPPHERRVESDRRTSPARRKKVSTDMFQVIEDLVPQIENILFALNENLRTSAKINKKKAESEESKSRALKTISECMARLLEPADKSSARISPDRVSTEPAISGGDDESETVEREKPVSRELTMAMISKMRKDHMTYSQIAEHLRNKGVPTFSNRGEWHAQTIHRLCSKKGITPNKPSTPDEP